MSNLPRRVAILDRQPGWGPRNVTFQSARRPDFSKSATLLGKFDLLSNLPRRVALLDRQPGWGPRNVTFQSALRAGSQGRQPGNATRLFTQDTLQRHTVATGFAGKNPAAAPIEK